MIYVIKKEDSQFKIEYKLSNYQLWESEVNAFLSVRNKDFIILNKDGINFIRLDDMSRKSFKDKEGSSRMVHSLSSMNYLKNHPDNML